MFTGDLPAEHLLQCVSVFDVLARQTERTFTLFGIKPQQEPQVRDRRYSRAGPDSSSEDCECGSPQTESWISGGFITETVSALGKHTGGRGLN